MIRRGLTLFFLGVAMLSLVACEAFTIQVPNSGSESDTTPVVGRLADIFGTLEFVSRGENIVSNFSIGEDDKLDVHLRITLSMVKPRTVKMMRIYGTDEFGEGDNWRDWDTYPGGGYLLLIKKGDQFLNPKNEQISDLIIGQAAYDLYFNNFASLFTTSGNHFVLAVDFGEEWDNFEMKFVSP